MHAATEMRDRQMLVGGKWVDSAGGETIAIENPGNRNTIGHGTRLASKSI